MAKRVRKAVFPVAGLGTRFLPATKVMAKEMLPLVDKPLIQHAVEEARAAGIEEFIFVTAQGKQALEDHFDIAGELYRTLEGRGKTAQLEVAREAEIPPGKLFATRQKQPLGLGHAVWCARAQVGDEPFAVLLPDDVILGEQPCLKQMVEAYDGIGGNVVAVVDVPREQTDRYGILDTGAENGALVEVRGLVEKPKPADAPSTLSIIGRYILQPEVFDELERHERGAGGEIQLTDGMARLIGRQPFHGLRFEGTRYDCGDKLGWLEANLAFALARPDMADKVRAMVAKLV
ncbi:UTP--glucose-1-phosphate uridylyltransferase GalU [Arenibaculum pallidiluteum]|uniref:UTP--glucose-1-phosphate uridylyltransferase GalU n=1 Tax=Arenibaculum pallidiluteum TaxID=2812559 RepID=UPI001A9694F0|nr:UTP--glucose-1-phosphate uridylyltransferase GalU [Arenibaculum pallidiluteum]